MSRTIGGAGYDPRRSWQGTETARQAFEAHRTVMCFLGQHEQCVHYQLCECDCHRGVEETPQPVHYGVTYVGRSLLAGVALCGARSSDAPGSVGILYSSSWVLVDCAECLARQGDLAT